jgi:hypothetical protein
VSDPKKAFPNGDKPTVAGDAMTTLATSDDCQFGTRLAGQPALLTPMIRETV